jgi:tetratricopeptide (TPR) repeat protein
MVEKQAHPLLRNRAAGLSAELAHQLDEALAALGRQQIGEAEALLAGVLAREPDCVEAQRLLGLAQQLRGDHAQALATLRQVVAKSPGDALAQMNLGILLHSTGEPEAALALLRRACELAPDFAPAWFNFGRMLMLLGRPAGAITALHRVLDHDPDHLAARRAPGQAQVGLGCVAPAAAHYSQVLQREPVRAEAWAGLYGLVGERFDKDDVARLRQALKASLPDPMARTALGFVLARALEDQADFHEAFRVLRKANAQMRRRLNWNAASARARANAVMAAFAGSPGAGEASAGGQVIFVVGLPCSGAALTARTLIGHPQAGGDDRPDLQQDIDAESQRRGQPLARWAGAATAEDWARLGQDYLARSASRRGGKPWLIDACLPNWLLLGAAMAMLPGARVVDVRRDPLETCFDGYRQLFASGNEFSYELDDIASHWHDYDRLVRHWRELFPGRLFVQDSESLLAAPDTQLRQLLAFCGLDDDPVCLDKLRAERSARPEMVRGALYGSELDRLRKLLGVARKH